MFKVISYKEFQNDFKKESYILIDVRSPGEYDLGTIPGAINIPIFTDKERHIVGTTYKEKSVEKAKKLGVEFVSKKLPVIYDKISKLNEEYENLLFFCSRGGYRSNSIVYFLASLGINVLKLESGYKGYRNHIVEELPRIVEEIKFVVLYGNTGTGKTEILKHLKSHGMNVLDLEGAANHRGSTLGSVGLGEQSTQKMFESYIYKALSERKGNLVFVEGESRRIGKDVIPKYLFKKMKEGVHINIKSPLDYRIETILKAYVHGTNNELIDSLDYLRKRLGNKKIDFYIKLIKENKHEKVIEELMVNYYDPMYENNTRNIVEVFKNTNHEETAKKIIRWTKENL